MAYIKTIRVGFFDYREETKLWPRDYALTQRQVDTAMYHGAKDCIGEACDLDFNCKRHSRTAELVNRYLRRKKPNESR